MGSQLALGKGRVGEGGAKSEMGALRSSLG